MPKQPLPQPPRRAGSSSSPARTGGTQFEYRVLTLPSRTNRADAAQLMTEHAEYGRWELARSVVYFGGARKIWLRRRIQRVQRVDRSPG